MALGANRRHILKQVTIFSDGACSGNPGPGGWGAILRYGVHEKEICGGEAQTTNNRMELTAVLRALQLLKEPCEVTLCSDSKYVIDALSKGWAKSWQKNHWIKSDKKPALNADLWEQLLAAAAPHILHYHWIKGHAGHPENERCDQMAVAKSMEYKV
jgi:ribonuclease HI